jgi:AraC family transcriptional regulator
MMGRGDEMRHQKTLIDGAGLAVRLTWYRPGEQMAPHAHDCHQVSWLLSGELREVGGAGEHDVVGTSRGVKPAGFRHANLYGVNGALVLGVDIDPEGAGCCDLPDPGAWAWADTAADVPIEILRLATASDKADADPGQTLTDLAACALEPALDSGHDSLVHDRVARSWLDRVREQLRDDPDEPDLSRLAEQAGVHRVHLSRSFRRRFGLPPSRYRLQCRVSRAIADMVDGAHIAEAALAAGFADQSHLTRVVRTHTGFTPGHLRALIAA